MTQYRSRKATNPVNPGQHFPIDPYAKSRKLSRQLRELEKATRTVNRNTNNIRVVKVSEPFDNPFITAPGLNPVRTYKAEVIRNGKVVETLTGVIFANQGLNDQLQHHASLRGHGLLPVYGSENIPPFGSEYESYLKTHKAKK